MNHRFTVEKTLKLSCWAFDEPNMRAGESGTITGWVWLILRTLSTQSRLITAMSSRAIESGLLKLVRLSQ